MFAIQFLEHGWPEARAVLEVFRAVPRTCRARTNLYAACLLRECSYFMLLEGIYTY